MLENFRVFVDYDSFNDRQLLVVMASNELGELTKFVEPFDEPGAMGLAKAFEVVAKSLRKVAEHEKEAKPSVTDNG